MPPGGPDLGWQDRLAILRGHVLDRVPVLVLLDNFEDNLRPGGQAEWAVGDEVLAGLLAAWISDPGRSPGCWSPAGTGSPCPAPPSGSCRSGSWRRCPGPRR